VQWGGCSTTSAASTRVSTIHDIISVVQLVGTTLDQIVNQSLHLHCSVLYPILEPEKALESSTKQGRMNIISSNSRNMSFNSNQQLLWQYYYWPPNASIKVSNWDFGGLRCDPQSNARCLKSTIGQSLRSCLQQPVVKNLSKKKCILQTHDFCLWKFVARFQFFCYTLSRPNFNLVVLSPLAFFYCNQLAPCLQSTSTLGREIMCNFAMLCSFVLCNHTNCKLFFAGLWKWVCLLSPLLAILDTIELFIKYPKLALVLPKLGVWSKVKVKKETKK
jgi:hypothetical protein